MRFASVAELKGRLAEYLAQARKKRQAIVVTYRGKPYALTQPLTDEDLEAVKWRSLAKRRLAKVWEDEEDALYAYL